MLGSEAFSKLIADHQFTTVADVGCGDAECSRQFRQRGKIVTLIDLEDRLPETIVGDYLNVQVPQQDCIWCCHVLEHQLHPHAFLRKMHQDLVVGGVLALTVPPYKPTVVDGHVSLWNAGLLLYHLVLAGFDCTGAAVKTYGYNVSVIVVKCGKLVPHRVAPVWDIREVAEFLPPPFAKSGFDGDIEEYNW